ncbi:MAG: IS481 family transposase ISAisp3 [Immundisolibacter sp.]|nr:IS481 family transposase ISAisp3 [Immundisolibacter sp.]
MADEDRRRSLFVAIDRATRWVYVALKPDKSARGARAFLNALAKVAKAAPFRIHTLLTDDGTEFTDRLFGSRARAPTGTHEFDRLCQALGIEHRLTRPRRPQTNGMVERFNGRIADPGSRPGQALLRTHHFRSGEDLEQTLHRYVTLHNHTCPSRH